MAHIFSTRGSQQVAFSELESALESHGTDPAQSTAWATGGSSEASMAGSSTLRVRAVERMTEIGFHPDTNLSVEWNNDEGALMLAALDCESGLHIVSPRLIV